LSKVTVAPAPRSWPALLLCLMMVLAPGLGYPGEEMLQDTLKSIVVSFFALAAALIFLANLQKKDTPVSFHHVLLLPLALMLYALGSMAWSHTYLGGVEAVRWFVFSLIFCLGLNSLTLARVTLLAWGIHIGAVIASLWAALQFWVDFKFFAQGPNPASTFVNRNFFAEFVVCTLPFSVLLLTRVKDKTSVFLLTFSLGFNIAALMMAGTRSALVALLLLLVLVPVILFGFRKQLASTGWRSGHVVAVMALLVTSVFLLGSVNSGNPRVIAESGPGNAIDRALTRTASMAKPTEYSKGSFSIRAVMWRETGRMIAANPIGGVGAGAWEVQAPLYQQAGSQLETDYYPHNEILQLVAEYGLVGWLFLMALAGYLVWAAYTTWADRSEQGKQEAPLRSLTLASLLVFLLVSNAGFAWRMAATGALFALSLAILAASDVRLGAGKRWLWRPLLCRTRYSALALYATAVCAAVALYIAQQAVACEGKIVRAIKIALAISQSGQPNDPRWQPAKAEMLTLLREGIAINPHYRKLTPVAADALAQWGDWKNATWLWDSVLQSRPHIVLMLANAARGHMRAGDFQTSQSYLDRAKNIQPSAPSLVSLELMLWGQTGRERAAAERAKALLNTGKFDHDLVQAAYFLGTLTRDPALAIQAMELGIKAWPAKAADGWLKLGSIYDSPDAKDEAKAMQAYRAALEATPVAYKTAVLAKIPPQYRSKLQ
jgi:O-antigen ligase